MNIYPMNDQNANESHQLTDTVIKENIYCLSCGYNLRGLSGDPIRCPECGELNNLKTAMVPAKYIHKILVKMETAPTMCLTSFMVIVVILILAESIEYGCYLIAVLLFTLLWILSYFRMKKVYENKHGWKQILVDYHISGIICLIPIPLFLMFVRLGNYTIHEIPNWALIASAIISIPSFSIGLQLYKKTNKQIIEFQKDKAVQIAREISRKKHYGTLS